MHQGSHDLCRGASGGCADCAVSPAASGPNSSLRASL